MTETMTPKERVWAAINLHKPDRTPCAIALNYFVARHKGVSIAEYLKNFDLQVRLNHQEFDELGGVDLVMLMPPMINPTAFFALMPMKTLLPGKDIPADSIPQAQEMEIMPVDGYGTILKKGWIRFAKEDLFPHAYPEMCATPAPQPPPGPSYDIEADRRFYEDRHVFVLMGIAIQVPYELFSFARSMEKFAIDLYRQPDKVLATMDAIMPELIEATCSMMKPGDPVMIPISRGSNGFISPKQFEKFVFPYVKRASEVFTAQRSPIFFHLDQTWTRFLPYFRELPQGSYVLHFDGMTDMFKAKEVLGDKMCLMGDVPAPLFSIGTVDDMKAYCKKLIDVVGKGGGLILTAGCSVPDTAKFENIKALVDTARDYRP